MSNILSPKDKNKIGHWTFDEGRYYSSVSLANVTISQDSSRNPAFTFNGSTSTMLIDTYYHHNANVGTVSFKVKSTTTAVTQNLFAMNSANFRCIYSHSLQKIGFQVNGEGVTYSNNTVDLTKELTIVCTWDGSYKRIYIDGVENMVSSTTANTPSVGNIHFGCNSVNYSEILNGYLSEIILYNRALTQEEVTNYSAGDYEATNGLLYKSPFAYDYSGEPGLQSDVTLGGVTLATDNNGVSNNAYEFNSKADVITPSSQIGGTTITASMMYYYNGTSGAWNTLLCENPTATSFHMLIEDGTGEIGFYDSNSGGWNSSGYALTAGTWYHLLLTKDGTNSKLYVDNVLRQDTSSSFDNNTHPIGLIGNRSSLVQGAIGRIASLKIWNYNFNEQERLGNFNQSYAPEEGLVFSLPPGIRGGNNGILSGCTYVKLPDGSYGLKFLDTQHANFGRDMSLSSNNITYMFWFKGDSTTLSAGETVLFKAPDTGYDREIGIQFGTDKKIGVSAYRTSPDLATNIFSDEAVYDKNWHHFAIVKDILTGNTRFSIYYDGNLIKQQTLAYISNLNSSDLEMSKVPNLADRGINGTIRQLLIINGNLSEQVIKKHYQETFIQ